MDFISLLCVAIVGFQVLRFLFRTLFNFIAPRLGINTVDFKATGKWAVITGATDGVGKAYAEMLAKKGMSIMLISRSHDKLEDVARQIAHKYYVDTKTIAVDFVAGEAIYAQIDKQLQGLEIGVLVNNVGMSFPYPEYFLAQNDSDLYDNIIKCNIVSVTNMCKMIMPGMVERRRGVVINISSLAALVPSPMLAVYAASKAYIDNLSYNLRIEYGKKGIVVQCVLPGYVATKLSKIRKSTWMAPSAKTFVQDAIATVGVQDKTTGYYAHTLMNKTINTVEYIAPSMTQWFVTSTMENIRKRALKKKALP